MSEVRTWDQGRAEVDALLSDGKLQRIPASREHAADLMMVARQHVLSAREILGNDLEGAYGLVYDAIRKGMTAYLGVQGLRPTQSGGHVVLAEAARAQLVPPLANLVNTFDRLRRQRNLVEYPSIGHEELTPVEVEDDADSVEEALDQIDKLLGVLPVF
jgi:hypothetical protein